MSRKSVARPPSAPPPARDPTTDPEAIALRIHQIAATAGALAVAATVPDPDGEQLSHALYLIEETLLDVEQRVERLRRVPHQPTSAS
jgi:hypothetical protein